MCGIAGILFRDQQRPVESARLRSMAGAIAHRGPDAEGFYQRGGLCLTHRRLSIIDLSGGDQPIGNEDGSVQVVFNGEIYNHVQLRNDLKQRGHRFATNSDTEVLVHLYEERGERLVDELRGMFAFALWDDRQKLLLLARDRVGLKPLYVYRDNEKLLFGSEIKAILAYGDVDRTIDADALEDYLCYGVIPGERSIFRQIRKLPPAHTLVVRPDRMDPSPRRYWQFQPHADRARSVDDWREAIAAKIDETVVAHRLADVPVGAFLSGGIDSSLMVEAMTRLSGERVRTYSIGFREEAFSELPRARQVAARFGCDHHEEIVTPEATTSLDDLVTFYDEPFADSSAIPTLHVSRLARRDVKVVISGDGGDEAFGGYPRYAHDLVESRWRRRLPRWLRRTIIRGMAAVYPKADWLPRSLRAKTRLTNLSLEENAAYANTLSGCRPPLRRRLLHADVVHSLNGHRPEAIAERFYDNGQRNDPLSGMLAADVGFVLPDDFLVKVDRASMSCGLEVRPPLVDHELLELAGSLPSEFKVRGRERKWLLKRICRDRLPGDIVDGPKRGFEIPIDDWLRGPLRETFEDSVLGNSAVSGLLNQSVVGRVWNAHLKGTARQGGLLWSLLVLARWSDRYVTTAQAGNSATDEPRTPPVAELPRTDGNRSRQQTAS